MKKPFVEKLAVHPCLSVVPIVKGEFLLALLLEATWFQGSTNEHQWYLFCDRSVDTGVKCEPCFLRLSTKVCHCINGVVRSHLVENAQPIAIEDIGQIVARSLFAYVLEFIIDDALVDIGVISMKLEPFQTPTLFILLEPSLRELHGDFEVLRKQCVCVGGKFRDFGLYECTKDAGTAVL